MGVREGADAEPETRKYLLDEWHSFYATYVRVALDGDKEFGEYTHNALHPRLVALESGAAVEFRRYELPPGHGLEAPHAGRPDDTLWIDEQNVIHDEQ